MSAGLLQGEIHCDELSVENGGKVRGTVYSEHVVIEREGCFVGERQRRAASCRQRFSHRSNSRLSPRTRPSQRSTFEPR